MRILLVNSCCKFQFIPPLYPIALVYIGSYVLSETDAAVIALDLNLYDNHLDILEKTLKETKPDVVGLSIRDMPWHSSLFSSPVSHISKICQVVKTYDSNIKLIAGGPCFSLFSDKLMALLSNIDIGVECEGEEAFVEVINNFGNLNDIQGIFYRAEDRVVYTGPRPFMCVDNIPIPQDIPGINPLHYNYVGVQTRRGCSFECIYCPTNFLHGKCMRLRSVEKIIKEIEFYKNQGVTKIYFADTLFNMPDNFAEKVMEGMIKAGVVIQWGAQFKPSNLDASFLEMAQRAGCRWVDLTADCGSDRVLETLKTGIKVKDILETAMLINKFNAIIQSWYFMTNLPGEGIKANFDTIKLILKLIKLGVNPVNILINRLKYCPHTESTDLFSNKRVINIDKPAICSLFFLLDKDIGLTCLIGLFNVFRLLRGFKRHAY